MSETNNAPTVTQPSMPANPFQRQGADHVSAGAVEIESARAIAEAQAKMVIAKRFPRDEYTAMQRIMNACSRESLAQEAFYSYDRGGSKVTGPSIRLAEVLASCWGNIEYGINELSRRDGESEMQAYCWDLETNTFSQQKFTVAHMRDKRGGGVALTEQRDIYEIGANMGARRLRARILAIIPKDVIDTAEATCKATLAGGNKASFDSRIKRMISAFNTGGVTLTMIETRLGKKIADITVDELADLTAVYNALKDGAPISEYFGTAALSKVAEPRQESGNSQAPKSDNSPKQADKSAASPANSDDASGKKGRPSKDEVDAARNAGAADRRAGAPLDSCPEERPSIMAAWREGWQAEDDAMKAKRAADADGDGGVPFETSDEGDAAPASGSAPAIKEPAATADDGEPDLPANLRRAPETKPADSGADDDFGFGE